MSDAMETDLLAHDQSRANNKRKWWVAACIGVIIVIVVAVSVGLTRSKHSDKNVSESVTSADIMVHLNALYAVAMSDPNFHGSRSVTDGYNASGEYILETLKQTGYAVKTQPLVVPVWWENTDPQLSQYTENGTKINFIELVDFRTLRYGGNVTWNISYATSVQVANDGCNPSDYNFTEYLHVGPVLALIADGGDCDYYTKAYNCEQAGATAGIIYRGPNVTTLSTARVRKTGWLQGDPIIQIPFFSATYTVWQLLSYYKGQRVDFFLNATCVMADTYNIIAETTNGDPSRTIIVGAHLDSVPQGPGLNDNGSGSAMILQLAILFSQLVKNPMNKIRFIWWGAEEIGLLGSYAYVNSLTPEEKASIFCALNFDMMASPNGIREVYNASQTNVPVDGTIVAKSTVVQNMFIKHFNDMNLPWDNSGMAGGSDYYPFIIANITAGALATGASAVKTEAERTIFGGLANAWLDPCYHLACDTPDNINQPLLQTMGQAAGDVIEQLAFRTSLT